MPFYLVISGEANWAYSVELEEGATYRIGRAADNDITVKDSRISSYHARLMGENGQFTITDLGSRNGLYLNGNKARNAVLSEGDEIRLGRTTMQFVSKLDPSSLSATAILSPRLSEPLLKTETKKLHDLVGDLGKIQDIILRGPSNQQLAEIGEQLGDVVAKLREVEMHTRTLISTNHFHEIFHQPRPLKELLQESMRFVAAAVEAENAAMILAKEDDGKRRISVEVTMGLSVAGWPSGVPDRWAALIHQCLDENKLIYIRSVSQDPRFQQSQKPGDGTGDHRSILIAPIRSSRGSVLGVAYFDNATRPQRLNSGASSLAEGCLAILADHLTGESQPDSSKKERQTTEIFFIENPPKDSQSRTVVT